MSTSLALRNELRSAVLRGLHRLRDIELARELADEMVLEARMTVASTLADQFDEEWAPSPEEILAGCIAIQDTWSEEERDQRGRFEYTSTRDKRHVADFNYLKRRESVSEKTQAAYDRHKRYRDRNRERILAQRQDPSYQERRRKIRERSAEKNKLLVKQRRAEQREEICAYKRSQYHARIEAERERSRARWAANRDEINSRRRERYAAKLSATS